MTGPELFVITEFDYISIFFALRKQYFKWSANRKRLETTCISVNILWSYEKWFSLFFTSETVWLPSSELINVIGWKAKSNSCLPQQNGSNAFAKFVPILFQLSYIAIKLCCDRRFHCVITACSCVFKFAENLKVFQHDLHYFLLHRFIMTRKYFRSTYNRFISLVHYPWFISSQNSKRWVLSFQ